MYRAGAGDGAARTLTAQGGCAQRFACYSCLTMGHCSIAVVGVRAVVVADSWDPPFHFGREAHDKLLPLLHTRTC